jgi:outer membrane protein assembly factor BamD
MKKRALLFLGILAVACGGRHHTDLGSQLYGRSDRTAFEEAQKLFGKRRYEDARQQFKRVVDGFPNSEYMPQARLGIADTYFQQGGTGNYVLAISEYRQFLTLYPSAPQSDYAQFQVAECYFKQRHGVERDQTPTRQSLEAFQKVIDLHPQSKYAEQARSRIAESRQTLARGDFLVGYFYQHARQAFRSATRRYEALLTEYPEYTQTDEVLYRLSECLLISGRKPEAAPHLQRLISSFPDSRFAAEAKSLLKQADAATPTPSPTATAQPPAGEAVLK